MKKRHLLQAGVGLLGSILASQYLRATNAQASANAVRRTTTKPTMARPMTLINKTEAEWQAILTPEQFYVLRKHGTERAFTSPLDKQYGAGTYVCAGCDLPLFKSEAKFNSGTGWPSFFQPIAGAIATSSDRRLFITRVEVHCSRCGGHLGHVFDDGPAPTGKRYCMNGVALKFIPA